MVVYLATNLVNGKHYVGKTTGTLKRRWTKHGWQARSGEQTYFHNAMRKYGSDAFSVVSLASILATDPQLKEHERFWIRLFNATDPRYGYNLTTGGDGAPGRSLSFAARQKIGNANRGRVRSAEARRKTSEGLKGKVIPVEVRRKIGDALRGRTFSAEHCRRLSKVQKGKVFSAEHRRNIGEAMKGRKRGEHSPEHRRKISAALKGRNSPNEGKPFTPEHKRNLGDAISVAKFLKKVAWG